MANQEQNQLKSFMRQAGAIIAVGLFGIIISGFFHKPTVEHAEPKVTSEKEVEESQEAVTEIENTKSTRIDLTSDPINILSHFEGNLEYLIYRNADIPKVDDEVLKAEVDFYTQDGDNLKACTSNEILTPKDLWKRDEFVLVKDNKLFPANYEDINEIDVTSMLLQQRVDGKIYWEDIPYFTFSQLSGVPTFSKHAQTKVQVGGFIPSLEFQLNSVEAVDGFKAGKQAYFDLSQSKFNPTQVQLAFDFLNKLLDRRYLGEKRTAIFNLGYYDLNKVIMDKYKVEDVTREYNMALVVDKCPTAQANEETPATPAQPTTTPVQK